MSIEDRLQELGIILPQPAKPAGSYKPCVMVDNIAYISGQGPILEDGSFAKGVVGKDLSLELAQEHAQKCGLAILSALKNEIKDIHDKFKVTSFTKMKSSLKFCVVAAGEFDLYVAEPRASEWDIAAGDAILSNSGGSITDMNGEKIYYGKKDFKNPSIILKSARLNNG